MTMLTGAGVEANIGDCAREPQPCMGESVSGEMNNHTLRAIMKRIAFNSDRLWLLFMRLPNPPLGAGKASYGGAVDATEVSVSGGFKRLLSSRVHVLLGGHYAK